MINSGDLIARLELDDPGAVTAAVPYPGGFPELGPPLVHSQGVDHRFKEAYAAAKMIMAGTPADTTSKPMCCHAAASTSQPRRLGLVSDLAVCIWGVYVRQARASCAVASHVMADGAARVRAPGGDGGGGPAGVPG